MKRILYLSLALLLAVAVFWLLPTEKAQAAQLDYSLRFGYNQLNTQSQKRIYELLEAQVEAVGGMFIIPASENATGDDYFDAAKQLALDRPDLFYFDGYGGLAVELRDGRLVVNPQYVLGKKATQLPETEDVLAQLELSLIDFSCSQQIDMHRSGYGDISVEEIRAAKQTYEQQVQSILDSIPASANTQEAKVKYIHDHLVRRIEYMEGDNDQNSYSAIVERKTVCAGYAKSFQDLMNRLGIRCWYITGYSGQPHAWNVLWLNGECVYTDVTWADQGHYIRYEYYNISREQMSLDHDMNQEYEEVLGSCNHQGHRHVLTPENAADSLYRTEEEAMYVGDQLRLNMTALGQNITFFSSDPSVATVDGNGLITAIAPGNTEVLILLHDEGIAFKYCITVSARPHTHSLRAVPETPAGCTAEGQKAHYICTGCGQKFLNAAGQQSADVNSLRIAPTGHSTGPWSYDEGNHWKACTRCGERLEEGAAVHCDANDDDSCDICGWEMTAPTVPAMPTVPTTAPTVPATGTVPSVLPTVPAVQPTSAASDQTIGPAEKEPENTTATIPGQTQQTSQTAESTGENAESENTALIVICVAAAFAVIFAVGLVWVKMRKKR